MRWGGGRESDNVEDRRSESGGGGRGIAGGGIGVVVITLIAMYFGVDPSLVTGILGGGGSAPTQQETPAQKPPPQDTQAKFVSVVLADTEDTWNTLFKQSGSQYRDPKLVLFRGAIQ